MNFGFGFGLTVSVNFSLGGWNPLNLGSGLSLWLRPESLPASGAIDQWIDSSDNANHAVQAVGANQPIVLANAIGSVKAASFDGISHFMTLGSEINDADGFELWAVMNKAASGSTHVPFGGGVSGNDYIGFLAGAPDSPLAFRTSDVGSTTVSTNSFAGEDFLVRVTRDVSDGLVVEKDGTDVTDGTPSNAGSFDFQILGSRAGGSNFAEFDLCELVVTNAPLATADATALYAYFNAKYPSLGITVPSPSGPTGDYIVTVGGNPIVTVGGDYVGVN